jgi:hypothetical protein
MKSDEAGILTLRRMIRTTVAAQRWTLTSFHLYALASEPLSR